MLKRRIVAIVLVRNGLVVQSLGFKKFLPVGHPEIAVEFLNDWGVDEIILLDITATRNGSGPNIGLIKEVAKHCMVPLTVGGGLQNLEQVRDLIRSGADKVSFNQSAMYDSDLLTMTSRIFGSQCVVASIDAVRIKESYRVYDYLEQRVSNETPAAFANKLSNLGVGEILINSVDRDGSKLGYDLELVKSICQVVKVPIICSGGAGKPEHFLKVFEDTEVHSVAAANFFHFTEHSVTQTKAVLRAKMDVRNDAVFNYNHSKFDPSGRLKKKPDQILERMLFERIEKEFI